LSSKKVNLNLGIPILIAWLLYSLVLYPFPNQQIERITIAESENSEIASVSDLSLDKIYPDWKQDLWISWGMDLLIFIMGIASAVIFIQQKRFCKIIVLVPSIIFLITFWSDLRKDHPDFGFFDFVNWKLQLALSVDRMFSYIGFAIFDLILPIFHIFLLLVVGFILLSDYRKNITV